MMANERTLSKEGPEVERHSVTTVGIHGLRDSDHVKPFIYEVLIFYGREISELTCAYQMVATETGGCTQQQQLDHTVPAQLTDEETRTPKVHSEVSSCKDWPYSG
jgi:hypothetical protein